MINPISKFIRTHLIVEVVEQIVSEQTIDEHGLAFEVFPQSASTQAAMKKAGKKD